MFFLNFYERYIDEIGKPFDEFHLHEKNLYIHIDIAVQNKYIKQSCEGQTDGFIQKFCLPFRLQQTEKRALYISCCLPSCRLKISDQCAWAHQANSASAQTTAGGHRWAKKAVPWPKEMTRVAWGAFLATCVPFLCLRFLCFRFSLRLNVSRPRFGLLQLLNMCSSSERSASVARFVSMLLPRPRFVLGRSLGCLSLRYFTLLIAVRS